jgi:glycosyltransferase involved in cell wall biosynthesis
VSFVRVLKAADVTSRVTGGVNVFMRESAAAIRQDGHDVDLWFREDLVPRLRGPVRRLIAPWLLALKLLRGGRTAQYDVVEIHEPSAAAYCLVRRLIRLDVPPCVVVSYGSESRRWRAQRRRWKLLGTRGSRKSRLLVPMTLVSQADYALRHCEQVLAPSDRDADYMATHLRVRRDRITRADSGVSDRYFALGRAPYEGEALKLIFIGTWIDRKGVPELMEAWSSLSRSLPGPSLSLVATVAGEGEVLGSFTDGRERVTVRPRVSEPELMTALEKHHAFVLPAWFEGGTPLAALQAAAAGLACVVTSIGGHIDVFREVDPESDGALLVPPHNGRAVAAAVERLAADPALVERLGANARARARAFTWEHTARQSLDGYRRAVGDRRRIPGGRESAPFMPS